ncbi:MAG: phosphatidylserine decarboxylase family protein, partial [Pelagibacteraceae bacterium]|nr:phosphatidylserine decarboxylase family protein [Pelagibacteraceae bacterium]
MQLKIHNEGWVYFVISCLITIIIIPFYTILGISLCILSAYIFYFFRDPVRSIPGEKVIVSPADGLVTFIGITKNPLNDETDQNSYKKISIFLSVFDVHVNRMPVDAKISQIKYIPGKFINATLDKSSEENERNIILAENNNDKFYIVQIAGLIARRIVCSIKNNQEVNKGDRIGIIKFGSRVDLYLP